MADITAPNAGGTTNGTETDDVITSGPNVDTINGLGGNDILVSGFSSNGPDTLAGGPGNDTFRIAANNFGFVNITDFTRGQDKIDVAALGFADLASLLLVGSQQDGLSRFEFYQGGSWNKIDVIGVALSSFVASDFVFNTSNEGLNVTGTLNFDTVVGGPGPDILEGGDGPDLLIGGPNLDMLDGGAGDDRLFGGTNFDTAVLTGNRSDYRISAEGAGLRIDDLREGDNDGSDYLESIEFLNFADETYPASLAMFSLLSDSGFAGQIGGSGKIFGSAGFQDIAVLAQPGRIEFDGSFNQGGDIVRLPGNASDWQVELSGSTVVFEDGSSEVLVPIGVAGMPIVFADGLRVLKLDQAAQTVSIGTQVITDNPVTITAPVQASPLPSGAEPAAQSLLLLNEYALVTASGKLSIFGTRATESVHLQAGNATLDGSFNQGGDTLILDQPATAFVANLSGSAVFLDSATTDVRIPIGTTGIALRFADGPDRILVLDPASEIVTIGTQTIGITPVALAPFA